MYLALGMVFMFISGALKVRVLENYSWMSEPGALERVVERGEGLPILVKLLPYVLSHLACNGLMIYCFVQYGLTY